VYYDFAAQARIRILNDLGLSPQVMMEHGFGPILFREECVFRRELRMNDAILIDTRMARLRRDHARWSFRQTFIREADGTPCAVLSTDGAWMDTRLRKLTTPPAFTDVLLESIPRTEDFEWTLPGNS
jgi:acyl-CoA thioester hydrolase